MRHDDQDTSGYILVLVGHSVQLLLSLTLPERLDAGRNWTSVLQGSGVTRATPVLGWRTCPDALH